MSDIGLLDLPEDALLLILSFLRRTGDRKSAVAFLAATRTRLMDNELASFCDWPWTEVEFRAGGGSTREPHRSEITKTGEAYQILIHRRGVCTRLNLDKKRAEYIIGDINRGPVMSIGDRLHLDDVDVSSVSFYTIVDIAYRVSKDAWMYQLDRKPAINTYSFRWEINRWYEESSLLRTNEACRELLRRRMSKFTLVENCWMAIRQLDNLYLEPGALVDREPLPPEYAYVREPPVELSPACQEMVNSRTLDEIMRINNSMYHPTIVYK